MNPKGFDVTPGEAANKIVMVSEPVEQEDMSLSKKEKGLANVCVEIKDSSFGLECELNNWSLETLVDEFTATCDTQQCTGDAYDPCGSTVVKDTQTCHCTLPDGYTLDDPPPPGTPYNCVEIGPDGQPTGNACELQ